MDVAHARGTMTEWRFYASTGDGGPWMRPVDGKLQAFPLTIGTVPVWERHWGPVLGAVDVTDPHYGQPHRASIYEIKGENGSTARFAATEFSNGVWGFYIPCEAGDDLG